MSAREEMLRVQDLHADIAVALTNGEREKVRERFEKGFMTVAFQRECVADYVRWIKEWDALVAQLEQARKERDNYEKLAKEWEAWLDEALDALGVETVFQIKDAGLQVGQHREALEAMLNLYDRHAAWCGYNKDAPGDSSINRAPEMARAALSETPPAAVCVHHYTMIQGGMQCQKCGDKLVAGSE